MTKIYIILIVTAQAVEFQMTLLPVLVDKSGCITTSPKKSKDG